MPSKTKFVALAALAVVVSVTPALAGKAERLAAGDVIVRTSKVDGFDMPRAHVEAVIKAPPAQVWSLIEKCGNYKKTMPRIVKAKEVSREGDVVTCDVTIDLPFPLSDLQAVTKATHTQKDGTYKRAWKLVKGDYQVNEGSWTVLPHGDGHSLVKYVVFAVPNVSMPTFLQEQAQKSSLPNLIETLRAQVEPKSPK